MRLIWRFGIVGLLVVAVHLPVQAQGPETTATGVRAKGFTDLRTTATAAKNSAATTVTASIIASNMPLERVVQQLSEQSGVLVQAKDDAKDLKVTVIAPKPRPLSEILETLVNSNSALTLKTVKDGYEIRVKDN